MLKASQIMTRDFLTVTPEMGVEDLARLLLRKNVSGAVVVDKKGKALGVVTETDLVAKEKNLHLPTIVSIFDAVVYLESSEHFKEELHRMVATKVEDIYTKDLISILADTSLADIASIMTEKGIHYLPVIEEDRVAGVVTRHEILESLAKTGNA